MNCVEDVKIEKVYVCYYDIDEVNNTRKIYITTDEAEAKEVDPNYTLATLEDLEFAIAVGVIFDDGLVHIKEGVFEWYEDDLDEDDFGYRQVTEDKKRSA